MAIYDQKPWRRKHDNGALPAKVPFPRRRYYPGSLQDLIDIVHEAESLPEPKPEVRAVGSHWALSEAAVTGDFLVETRDPENHPLKLSGAIYDVLARCLTSDAMEFFSSQGVAPFDPSAPPDVDKFYLFHFLSGTPIWQAYNLMDIGDGRSVMSAVGDRFSIANELEEYDGPWAPPTLGGAGGQTIAGAFSTGTHGGDVHLPPIADGVQAIHLVGPEGRQYWIERELAPGIPLVDEQRLQSTYGEIEVIRDEEILHAVIVAAGRMGAIYSVVLRAVRQYALHEYREKQNWSQAKGWVNDINHAFFGNNRFVQVVVNPNGQPDSRHEHSCFVSLRTAAPIDTIFDANGHPRGRAERGGVMAGNSHPLTSSAFMNSMCDSDAPLKRAVTQLIDEAQDVRDKALITAGVAMGVIAFPFTPPPIRAAAEGTRTAALAAAAAAEIAIVALDQLRAQLPAGPLGTTLASIANWAADTDHFEYLRQLNEMLLNQQLDPSQEVKAISYAVMDGTNYLDVGCIIPGDSIEVFFDARDPNLVVFVERLFQRNVELNSGALAGRPLAYGGWISLRYMAGTRALIGMQQFARTCAVEIAGPSEFGGTEAFMAAIEKDAVELGGILHWGQRNNLDMSEVQRAFDPNGPGGLLFRWRAVLSRLSANGRLATFSTEFTRHKGLEVVQPIGGPLRVQPRNACAGSSVLMSWSAADNPPGTKARVEISGLDAPGNPVVIHTLPDLAGSMNIPMPAGRNVCRLILDTTLNGQTLSDVGKPIEIRGIGEGETWSFQMTAACEQIDGSGRWAVTINLPSQNISDALLAAEVALTFTSPPGSAWTARTVGHADVQFPAGDARQAFSRPVFNRLWQFFAQSPGCNGAPPELQIDFILTCTP